MSADDLPRAAASVARPEDLFGTVDAPSRFAHQQDMGRPGTGAHDEWLTPPALVAALGPFDLDPCSPIKRPWPTAERHYTVADDGLRQTWTGLVWCNPPYAEWGRWLHKLADHGDGIALIFARTETRDFFGAVWERADALLFLKGRIRFYRSTGKPGGSSGGAPSVLIAYGPRAVQRLAESGLEGRLVRLTERAA
jgi:hypothetical protein